jgi:2'-5' RNA ligase
MEKEVGQEAKRLFIALPVEGSLSDDALAWQASHVGWPVNWLSGKDLHLTVVSPWFETDVEKVVKKLTEFAETPRHTFFIDFNKVTFGPNRQSPRLIWAEGNPPHSLLRLKDDLEIALNRPDPRFYRLHLTLARFKAEDFGPSLPNLFDRIDWGAEIKNFVLIESILKPEGSDSAGPLQAEYIKIKEFSFAGKEQNS